MDNSFVPFNNVQMSPPRNDGFTRSRSVGMPMDFGGSYGNGFPIIGAAPMSTSMTMLNPNFGGMPMDAGLIGQPIIYGDMGGGSRSMSMPLGEFSGMPMGGPPMMPMGGPPMISEPMNMQSLGR